MALVTHALVLLHQYTNGEPKITPPKKEDAVRIGILGTGTINYGALLLPARSHPEAVVSAISSRSLEKAREHAGRHGIEKAYGSYQELLDDPDIDAVYVSLPNALHYEWARKALLAGKHCLVEKPFTITAAEARSLISIAEEHNKVIIEAYHNQFHPASLAVREMIESEAYGKPLRIFSSMIIPNNAIPKSDIRWSYDLGGGSVLDEGYAVSAPRFFLKQKHPKEIVSAKPRPFKQDPRLDEAMDIKMIYDVNGHEVESSVFTDLDQGYFLGLVPRFWEQPVVQIETEDATITFENYIMPHIFHNIKVTSKQTGSTQNFKHYKIIYYLGPRGETWWSSYRYQLEAFIDKVKGRTPAYWIEPEDIIAEAELVENIYVKSGLGQRHSLSGVQ